MQAILRYQVQLILIEIHTPFIATSWLLLSTVDFDVANWWHELKHQLFSNHAPHPGLMSNSSHLMQTSGGIKPKAAVH
jgi:hypothetical protein